MEDTPQYIKDKQLEIWLSKSPGERLKQALLDNDAMFNFWNTIKKNHVAEPSADFSANSSVDQ